MSAVHGVAWGLVTLDEIEDAATFKMLRREVRRELRTHRIRLHAKGSRFYTLTSTGKRSGHRVRAFLGQGDLLECCKIASALITPSDHKKAHDAAT